MAISSNLKVNGERLEGTIMEMAKIGPGIVGGKYDGVLGVLAYRARDVRLCEWLIAQFVH